MSKKRLNATCKYFIYTFHKGKIAPSRFRPANSDVSVPCQNPRLVLRKSVKRPSRKAPMVPKNPLKALAAKCDFIQDSYLENIVIRDPSPDEGRGSFTSSPLNSSHHQYSSPNPTRKTPPNGHATPPPSPHSIASLIDEDDTSDEENGIAP